VPCAFPSRIDQDDGEEWQPNQYYKKGNIVHSFSVFLILEEDKNKKEILVEILMKHSDKDPTNILFEVVRPVAVVPSMSALAAAGLAAALEPPGVPAVQWNEDEASFFVGVSWDTTHAVTLRELEDGRRAPKLV
jgi:hypothetical protein